MADNDDDVMLLLTMNAPLLYDLIYLAEKKISKNKLYLHFESRAELVKAKMKV